MSKLTDAELSLAVAKIMELDYLSHTQVCRAYTANKLATAYGLKCECGGSMNFDHTTDDALGKMCVWLAKECEENFAEKYGAEGMLLLRDGIAINLASDNPHRAIAEAILEASNE